MASKRLKKSKAKSSDKAQKPETLSYRLKCAKTANGLSHFIMYGDAPKGKSLL